MPDDDDILPEDRPELLPDQVDAASKPERKKREDKAKREAREDAEFLQRILQDPAGRRFLWGILYAAGTFEERYGFGPYGAVNQEASWSYRGQKDLGLRLYHQMSVLDRAGMLRMLDEFHPTFPKRPKGK